LVRRRRVLLLKVNALAQDNPRLHEFCALLNLLPGQAEYEMVVGESQPFPATFPPEPRTQIVLDPRTTFQAIAFLANGVVVPPEHVEQGLARNTVLPNGSVFDWTEVTAGLFRVCSVKRHHRPDHAYVAVRHHGYWFYIDDRDHASKMAFNLVFQLSRLDLAVSEARLARSRPLLTLPLGP